MAAPRKRTQKPPKSFADVEAVDDFETRARNAPEVYRFFNGPRGLATYLAGGWAGKGLQALPDWPAETAMSLRLSCEPETGGLVLRLRSHARSGGRGLRFGAGRLFAGLFGWLRNGSGPDAPAFQSSLEFQLDPDEIAAVPASGADVPAFGPDYARLRKGDWELTVQVLENIRAHAQLRRLGGNAPIYFSGVLHKQR